VTYWRYCRYVLGAVIFILGVAALSEVIQKTLAGIIIMLVGIWITPKGNS